MFTRVDSQNTVYLRYSPASPFLQSQREDKKRPLETAEVGSAEGQRTKRSKSLSAGHQRLSALYSSYGLNDFPGRDANSWLFYQFKELVQLIDLERASLSRLDQARVPGKVRDIIESNQNAETTLAELGCFYYTLCEKHRVPVQLSPFQECLGVKSTELRELKRSIEDFAEDPSKAKEQLSTGRVFFLLRFFAQLIVPNNGHYSVGGVYAVKKFLNSSLARHLHEENRLQILDVVKNILKDPRFRLLLEQALRDPLRVHPDMKIFISIDLKLPHQNQITSQHIFHVALMALFFPLRQEPHVGNCYAVAFLINLIRENSFEAMEMFLKILESDHYQLYNPEISVPLVALFKQHYMPDIDYFVVTKEEVAPAQFYSIRAALLTAGVRNPLQYGATGEGTFQVAEVLREISQTKHWVAETTFHSFKQPVIPQLCLILWQYVSSNGFDMRLLNKPAYSCSTRTTFFGKIFTFMRSWCRFSYLCLNGSDKVGTLLHVFEAHVLSRLSLVTQRNQVLVRNDMVSVIYTHEGEERIFITESEKTAENFAQALKRPKVFGYFENGKIVLVETIYCLAQYLVAIVDEVFENEEALGLEIVEYKRNLKNFLLGKDFQSFVARLLSDFADKDIAEISPETFSNSGALFLARSGGHAGKLMKALGYDVVEHHAAARTYRAIFINLAEHVSKMKKIPRILCVRNQGHIFNIYTRNLHFFRSRGRLLNQLVITPAKSLLSATISEKHKEELLLRFGLQDSLKELVLNKELSAQKFRDIVVANLESQQHSTFFRCFEIVLRARGSAEFLKNILPKILASKIPRDLRGLIQMELEGQFGNTRYTPVEFAQIVKDACLAYQVDVTLEDLEETIAKYFKIPHVIILGDFNWSELSENPTLEYLAMRYDLGRDRLILCKRIGHEEEDTSEAEEIRDFLEVVEYSV